MLLTPTTRGYMMHMFYASCRNFYADFFNNVLSLAQFSGFNPYHNGIIGPTEQIYPPLAYVLMEPFAFFMPNSIRTLEECYTSPTALTIGGVFLILMISAVAYACHVCCRKFHLSPFATVALVFSGLVLSSLERGNMIVFALAGISAYLCFYNSETVKERTIAIIGLALATSLKVTPVLFGVLWLNKKHFKELLWAGVISATVSFGPLFLSDHTLVDNVIQLLNNTIAHERYYSDQSVSINPACVLNAGVRVLGMPLAPLVPIVKWISIAIGVTGLWFATTRDMSKWERFFLLASAQILIPSAPQQYVALFFIPALLAFLAEDHSNRWLVICFMVLFFVLTTCIPLCIVADWNMNFVFTSATTFGGALLIEALELLKIYHTNDISRKLMR